jgi:hypothetical protein
MIKPKKIPAALFSFAGLSIERDGELTLRYSNKQNGSHKVKNLNMKLIALPMPMNRRDAISFACGSDYFTEDEQDYMIDKLDEFNGTVAYRKREPISIKEIKRLPNSVFDLARSMGL